MTSRRAAVLLATSLATLLGACERQMRDMYAQRRLDRNEGSPLFSDGRGSRPPPPDTVPYAMGDSAFTSGGRRGRDELAARDAADVASTVPAYTLPLLERGRQRFAIDCSPCHGLGGDGDGRVVQRGFPAPPSLHLTRLRAAPDRHVFDVISQGYGVMPSLADRVTPEDRWAITAYVRALQLSRNMPVAALDARKRGELTSIPHAASAAESRTEAP